MRENGLFGCFAVNVASLSCLAVLGATTCARGDDGIEFFEQKIRPVLVERCYSCHSSEAAAKNVLKGGLRLDTRLATRKGGDSGPTVVPGKPEDSLLIAAIRHESFKMPPKAKLPANVIADFVKWVEMGAPDPRNGKTKVGSSINFKAARKSWVYQSPKRPEGNIDQLVLAKLKAANLSFTAPANKRTLIRRAAYDLLGLPPTREEIDMFLRDDRPDAFARAVDRMLKSPDFGIRWARHWLDNVRYADDDPTCNANDNGRFSIGPYRDWVVKSFNDDLPYDQFVRLQVAGDLIPLDDPKLVNTEGHTATGIWGLAHLVEGNDKEKVIADFVDEQLDVLGRTFLGLTVSCARCHDHKFDPITQADYYGLAGIFYSSHIFTFEGKSARTRRRVQARAVLTKAQQREIEPAEKQLAKLESQIEALEEKYEKVLELMQVRRELKTQMMLDPKTANEKANVARRIKELKVKEANLLEDQKKKGWDENPSELKRHAKLVTERDEFKKKLGQFPLRLVMQEGPVPGTRHKASGDIPIFIRGDHLSLGEIAPRDTPRVFRPTNDDGSKGIPQGSGRLQLANWLTRPDHPLTSRVMANRIWQHLFGRGIVATPSNFGKLGVPPTHPELLDYLAVRFVESGWSVKSLIREIMTSRTYQQASVATKESITRDPDNRWFGRMNRKRLSAEALMDTLAWHDDRIKRSAQDAPGWKLVLSGRMMFEKLSRDKPQTTLDLFDGANPDLLVPNRTDSTSAPQALFMLNNEAVLNSAKTLAKKANKESEDEAKRITFIYRRLFGRLPTSQEQTVGSEIIRESQKARRQQTPEEETTSVLVAWEDLCVALICSNEFLYVD